MKIKIIKIGKLSDNSYEILAKKFLTRLSGFVNIDNIIAKPPNDNPKKILNLKNLILNKDNNEDHKIICLDERGRMLSSINIAKIIEGWQNFGKVKSVSFIIGDPYGIDPVIKDLSSEIWSLSMITMTSDLAYLTLCEQLYRAYTIINNIPYHHI